MKAYIFDTNFTKVRSRMVESARYSSEITMIFKDSPIMESAHAGCRDCNEFCAELQHLLRKKKCDTDDCTVGISINSITTDSRLGVKIRGDFMLSLSKLLNFNSDLWLKLYFSDLVVSYSTGSGPEEEDWTYELADTSTFKFPIRKDATGYMTTMYCPHSWRKRWVENEEKTVLSGTVKLMIGTENYD